MSFWCNFTILVFISNLAYLSVYRLVLRATQLFSTSSFLGVVISISQIACELGAVYLSKKWLSIVPGPQLKHVYHFVMIIIVLLIFLFFFFRFLSMRTQRNNNNRTHTHVKYNKLSTSARNERISQSRKQRTTTLAIPADDESNLMPNEPQSDFDDDEHPSI